MGRRIDKLGFVGAAIQLVQHFNQKRNVISRVMAIVFGSMASSLPSQPKVNPDIKGCGHRVWFTGFISAFSTKSES